MHVATAEPALQGVLAEAGGFLEEGRYRMSTRIRLVGVGSNAWSWARVMPV